MIGDQLIAIARLNEGAIDVNQPINWIHLLKSQSGWEK